MLESYSVSVYDQGHYHMPETRGLCLSEEQTISTVRVFLKTIVFIVLLFFSKETLIIAQQLIYTDLKIIRFQGDHDLEQETKPWR